MAKKKVEIEVEYPDCTICGTEIPGGGVYFDLRINLSRMKVSENGGAGGTGTGNSQRPLIICRNCADGITPLGIYSSSMKKIISELDKQKQELEQMDKKK